MAYDPDLAEAAAALKQFDIGVEDVPKKRKFDTWTEEDRKRYFKWDSIALPIPITNKLDLAKYGDLLCGLGAKLKYLAADREANDLGALMDASFEIEVTKRKLRMAGKIPTKSMQQKNKKTVSENDG